MHTDIGTGGSCVLAVDKIGAGGICGELMSIAIWHPSSQQGPDGLSSHAVKLYPTSKTAQMQAQLQASQPGEQHFT